MLTNISARITVTLMVVLSASVALIALLSFDKYRKAIEELIEARYAFVLQDVGQTLSLSLDLRIPLAELSSLQAEVERQRALQGDMQYIEIFDADGHILFSSDHSTIGDVLPDPWITANLASTGEAWRKRDEDDFVLGQPIRTSFGQTIGGIVLAYGSAPIQVQLDQMAAHLLKIALITVGVFVLLLLVALQLLLRSPRHRLRRLREVLQALPDGASDRAGLEPLALAAASTVQSGAVLIDETGAELQRLDQEP